MEIYPNPSSAGELPLRFSQEVPLQEALLVNVLGRMVELKFELGSQGFFQSQITDFRSSPGLYTVIVTTKDGEVFSEKVVIE